MSNYHDWRDSFQSQKQQLELQSIDIKGKIPAWVNGAFISTGPADFEVDGKHADHWFSGYAMLKGFYIKDGQVSFRNRFLLSDEYIHKELANHPEKISKFSASEQAYIKKRLETLKENSCEYDNGNVSVLQLDKTNLAMTETTSDVAFDLKTLETVGHLNYESNLQAHAELAHPSFDPKTQQWINVAAVYGPQTHYIFYAFDTEKQAKIELCRYQSDIPFYMHSFCVTENYFVLLQSPLIINASEEVEFEEALQYHENAPSQFIIIHRASNAVKIFPTDAYSCFHQANAYEADDLLIMDLCCYEGKDAYNALSFENVMKKLETEPTYLTRYQLNLKQQSSSKNKVCDISCEFPRIYTKKYAGRKYRYNYLTRDSSTNFFNGLFKVDMETGATIVWEKANCYCGEPSFVPNPKGTAEDDGVVLSLVFDANTKTSFLLVLDGKNFSELAQAHLPTFMPFGLHGDWFLAH